MSFRVYCSFCKRRIYPQFWMQWNLAFCNSDHADLFKQKYETKTTQGENEMSQQKASIGRVVLYCKYGSPGGEHLPEPSPAIITKVLNAETQECQLFVMNPNGVYFNPTPFSEELKPGHWSWPIIQK